MARSFEVTHVWVPGRSQKPVRWIHEGGTRLKQVAPTVSEEFGFTSETGFLLRVDNCLASVQANGGTVDGILQGKHSADFTFIKCAALLALSPLFCATAYCDDYERLAGAIKSCSTCPLPSSASNVQLSDGASATRRSDPAHMGHQSNKDRPTRICRRSRHFGQSPSQR
jgi:hypothetical protein